MTQPSPYQAPGSIGSLTLPVVQAPPASPAPPVFQNPLFGVNPYASSPPGSGTPQVTAPQLINTLGIPVPAPGVQTPEDLMANIQAGIAKLRTVNPELADQMAQQYGGDGQEHDEGGLLGALKDIGGAIAGGAGKAFELLGRTAHLVPAMLDPESWDDGNGFNTTGALGAITGADTTNWNQVFQHLGWDGGGLSGAFRAAVGLGGDILTDPLTYLTGGAAGVGTAEKAGMAGLATAKGLATAERAAELGFSDVGKMTDAIDLVVKSMGGEGVQLGKLAQTASADEAATMLAAHGASAVGSAHRELVKDVFEAFDNGYNAVQARTYSQWLRKGEEMKLSSGRTINPSDVQDMLHATIKAGTNQAPKSAEWLAAKAAAGVEGGIRVTPYIPFTKLRAIGPVLPYTNVVRPLSAVARFGAGHSASKRMFELVQSGEASWDDLATLHLHGYSALKEGANATLHTKELYEKLAQGGVVRSAMYTASERAGGLTAALTPGSKMFRTGTGYYFEAQKMKALKSTLRDIEDNQMYDIEALKATESGAEKKAAAGYGKNKLYQRLEESWGISNRKRKHTATAEDEALFNHFLDYFGGADDIPIDSASVANGTFDQWFWSRPENAGLRERTGAITDAPPGLEPGVSELHDAEDKLAKMKDVLTRVTGQRREDAQLVAKVQQRGADLLRSHGIPVRDVRYADLGKTGTIAFEDKALFERGVGKDIAGVQWYAKPESIEGVSVGDIKPDAEHGVAGVILTTNPEGAVPVAAAAQHPLVLGEASTEDEVQKFLQQAVSDDPIIAEARAEAEAKVRALEAQYKERFPGKAITVTSPIHPDNIEDTISQATMEVLKGRGGSRYDSILIRNPNGQHKLIMLGTDETAAWEQVKLLAHDAPRVKTSQGYATRGFTRNLREWLSGAPGGARAIHSVRDLEATALRKTVDLDFDQAELKAREVLADTLRKDGADEAVLAELWAKDASGEFAMPLFERNPLAQHERYVHRVSEGVASAVMGDMAERMNSLAKLLPQRFSKVAAISTPSMSIDEGILNALERVGNKATYAFDRVQRRERALHDIEMKVNERRAEDVGAVLERWRNGEPVDLAALTERNPQLRRVLEASQDLGATLKEERDKLAAERVHLDQRWSDHAQVEAVLKEQLGQQDTLNFKLLGDGNVEVDGWHGTNRWDTPGNNRVPTMGPEPGTKFSAGGLHLGPRRAAEDRIGSADFGMFDIVDNTTGEVVDTVEGRHVTSRIQELADEARAAEDQSTAGGQNLSNYTAHQLEVSDEEVGFLHDHVYPVRFKGRALAGKDGTPIIVGDQEAHFFGEVMQGKLLAVGVLWNRDHTRFIHITPLHDPQSIQMFRSVADDAHEILDAAALSKYDAVVYRNAVEGIRPSGLVQGKEDALSRMADMAAGKKVDPFNDTGSGKPLSLLIFDQSVPGKVVSIREEVERMLQNGELGLGKDGTVVTRAGKPRLAGKGGARRVSSLQELTEADADLVTRARDLEAYARGEQPHVGDEVAQYSNPGRAVKSTTEERKVAQQGNDILVANAGLPHVPVQPVTDQHIADIWEALQEPWGGKTLDLKTGEFVERTDGFAGGVVENDYTITIPFDSNLQGKGLMGRLTDAVHQAEAKWGDEVLQRPDVNLGIFRDEAKGTITIEPSIVVKTRQEAEAIATYLGSDGGFYDFATGKGVFPVRVANRQAESAAKRVGQAVEKQGRAVERVVKSEQRKATLEGAALAKRKRDLLEGTRAYNDIEHEYQGLESRLRPAMETGTATKGGAQNFMRDVDIPGLSGVRVHAYIADEMEWLLKDRPVGELRRAWKEFVLNPWKKWATYRSPGFHVRNAMGAWFNNAIGGVTKADYEFTHRMMQARDGVEKWANKPLEAAEFRRLNLHKVPGMAGTEGSLTYGMLADAMTDMGMHRGAATAVKMVDDGTKVQLSKGGKAKELALAGPRRYEHEMRRASSTVEDYFRTAAWAAGMRQTSGDIYGARAFVMMRHGDYGDLTETETFIKDLVPFYKWMRTNIPYQLRTLMEEPGKLLMVQKAQTALYEGTGLDATEYVKSSPDWMKQSLNIPLPWTKGDGQDPVQVLSLNLPMGDLYKGAREYVSSFLPVVGDLIESTALKQDLFTGNQLGVKMVPLSNAFNLPGIRSIMGALPGAQMRDGQVYIPDTFDNVLSAVPVYGRFRNWLSGDPNRIERRWGALTSFFLGAGTRGIDLNDDEKAFYYDVLEPTLTQYQSMGVVFPTKDQLVQAGLLAQTQGIDPNQQWPTGIVGQPTAVAA